MLTQRLYVLLAVLALVSFPGTSLAELRAGSVPLTEVDFMAVEEAPSNEVDRAMPAQYSFFLGGGIGSPEMDGLNDYTDWINQGFDGNIDSIDRYDQYSFSILRNFGRDLQFGLGYEFFEASTSGRLYYLGIPHQFSVDLDAKGPFLHLRKQWTLPVGERRLVAAGGVQVGYYKSTYEERENGYRVSGDDHAWGTCLLASLTWHFSNHVSLSLTGGYRWLAFDDYGVEWVSPGAPDVEIDFNGAVLNGALLLRM